VSYREFGSLTAKLIGLLIGYIVFSLVIDQIWILETGHYAPDLAWIANSAIYGALIWEIL
jgi:hypothetical protein